MLISSSRKQRLQRRARSMPYLHFVPFSIPDLIEEIREEHFPDLQHEISVDFVAQSSLACIYYSESTASIFIHQVLNTPDTPREVLSYVLKHELIHTEVRTLILPGEIIHHSPLFYERLDEIAPERHWTRLWISYNLGDCFKTNPKTRRLEIMDNWKECWSQFKFSIEELQRFGGICQRFLPTTETSDRLSMVGASGYECDYNANN